MRTLFFTACRVTVMTLFLTGIAYPLVITAVEQSLFSDAANGGWVSDEAGHVAGSRLLAQPFTKPGYFNPRSSAAVAAKQGGTAVHTYAAVASAGSNLGPTSKALKEHVAATAEALHCDNPADIPAALVTASDSGLDPHLSPQGVAWQVDRVAAARGVSTERVQALVSEFMEGRDLAVLGEPRVSVLQLNLALDRRFGQPH